MIEFSASDLDDQSMKEYRSKSVFNIEYFKGDFSRVTYVLSSDLEKSHLDFLEDGSEMVAIDTEWNPNTELGIDSPPHLIQIGTSKGALIIHIEKNLSKEFIEMFKVYIESHKFVEKGSLDVKKILLLLGEDTKCDFDNIELSRLEPYDYPKNFTKMVNYFVGQPVKKFKNKKITCSAWDKYPLTKEQIIYAAFDVVALYKCISKFPDPYLEEFETACTVKVSDHEHFYRHLKKHYLSCIQRVVQNLNNPERFRIHFKSKNKLLWFLKNCNPKFNVKRLDQPIRW